MLMPETHLVLAKRVASLFAERPEVEAVAMGGSRRGDHTDASSDIDLYVYTQTDIPVDVRTEIMVRSGGASRANMGLNFWGAGDEWFDLETGIEVDLIYFDAQWMADQIRRVMVDHQPSLGYSTCFPFTVQHSQVFYDPNGWFAGLQKTCQKPYPEPLRKNIIQHNHPVLRGIIPSYAFQIEKAAKRSDLVSINHRLAGLLASYFDILFALNRQLHPGEKRLVEKVVASCKLLPEHMEVEIEAVLTSVAREGVALLENLTLLLDHLDQLLNCEGFQV
jgi:hypothetical protein